ncbi:hypothetical protein ACSTS3_10705 [Aquimarina muelleri]|uniref:hypothetical protein n=1 Tax=Aquimarina muelleri TaxID=279356 RepID=UPI003F68328C
MGGKIVKVAKGNYIEKAKNITNFSGGDITKIAGKKHIKTFEKMVYGEAEQASFNGNSSKDNKVIALFKPSNDYKGEYGFDWCKWDILENKGTIIEFQGVPVSDIEYIFNNATNQYETANTNSKQKALEQLYSKKTISFGKKYYYPWMNLPKGKIAKIILNTLILKEKEETEEDEEYISFKENDDYIISYDGKSNSEIKTPIKEKRKGYEISIESKNETQTNSYIEAIDEKGQIVGIIEMAANKLAPFDIKIIPVVFKSTEAKEKAEAITLYNKAIKAKTTDLGNNLDEILNKHSLNQAGILSRIEPIKANPERIVIDLSKGNWSKFYDRTNNEFKNWEFNPTETDASKRPPIWTNEDEDKIYEFKEYEVEEKNTEGIVVGTKKVLQTKNDKRLLLDEFEEEYYSNYGKIFKGALLFVTEENYYEPNVLGYSQNNPLRSQGTIIFKGGLSMSDAYAHELGHMLGLEHVFIKKDKDEITEISNSISNQNRNITEWEGVIDNRKDLIEYENKRITLKIENIRKYGYKDDGSVDDQDWINEEQGKIKKYQIKIEEYNKEVQQLENKIEDFKREIAIYKGRKLKIKKGSSNNYMDYEISRLYFDKFQCLVIQKEIKDFYNE